MKSLDLLVSHFHY